MDREGVLRWQDDGAEVALFGVNYYTPFHWNYRDVAALGLSHEQVIDRDIAHLARLGLDVIRLHVFDREISDPDGNLVENEHLRLLDYLISRAKERGIYTVLTPIAWWQVPGESSGFSNRFTMHQMTTDPAAAAPQSRYLAQFVQHVNVRTGLSYKDDPAVIAFELINEPLYPAGTTDDQVTAYINTLADAVHSTGNRKPVFYNGWNKRLGALAKARVDGSTFGWYPTGLVAGHAWKRDALGLVDRYGGNSWNPQMTCAEMAGKAKIIYEFDAADIGGSYMYPAMARAFRAGGAQIATQFQYDPLPMAPFNAGWQTHYLNLSYTPNKAISFAIAAEAFRRLPRLKTYPPHPEGDRFGEFRVSFEEDLSEFVSREVYLHSNSTKTTPPDAAALERIAGCGSSPVVRYTGTGAYFLDRLEQSVWRIEVHPDAVWIADPFGPDKLGHEVSRVIWREREMEIRLPGLGSEFEMEALDSGNSDRAKARQGVVVMRPGVYLAHSAGASSKPSPNARLAASVGLPEFVAPEEKQHAPAAWMSMPVEAVAGRPMPLRATVASETEPASVAVELRPERSGAPERIQMGRDGPYRWSATVGGERLKPGIASIRLVAEVNGKTIPFPSEAGGKVSVVEATAPVVLFQSGRDPVRVHGQEPHRVKTVPGMHPSDKATRIEVDRFDPPPAAVSFRCEISEQIEHRRSDLARRGTLVLRARAAAAETKSVEVVVIERDGTPWGTTVPLTGDWRDQRVPLASLKFFQHWAGVPAVGRGGAGDHLNPQNIAALNVCFGAWLTPGHFNSPHAIEIERIAIE